MSDPQSSSVLVISTDNEVVEAIIGNNSSDQVFHARESVQAALEESELFENNGIIIFDIGTADNNTKLAIEQAVKLKQADPTQVLMIVGDKDPLGEILKSSIQPVVYRAFNKPISPNQIFLAFKSAHALHQELVEKQAAGEDISFVGPQENRTNVDTLAEQSKTNPAIYAGLGVLVLGVIAFLVFGGSDEPQQAPVVNTPAPQAQESLLVDNTVSETNELNQLAATAMLEGRFVSPKGDNAIEYYDRVLAIDPYDSIAYDGRKSVADALRNSYDSLVAEAKFDEALNVITNLKAIEPLNLENDKLSKQLESSITAHVKKVQASGTKEEIAATSKVLAKIESEFEGSLSASNALKAEQELIGKIQKALDGDNLIPPQKGNAYTLVSNALKNSKISKVNSEPLVKTLSSKLLASAKASLAQDNFEETTKFGSLIKRLNVDRQELASLDKALKSRRAEIAAEQAKEEAEAEAPVVAAVEEVAPEPDKIIPAKIISRAAPRYPSRALKSNKEGWVEVSFKIDTKGIPYDIKVLKSEPGDTFENAAVKSVKKWRFSPARNESTGLPVESIISSTKVQFRLS